MVSDHKLRLWYEFRNVEVVVLVCNVNVYLFRVTSLSSKVNLSILVLMLGRLG